MQLDIAFCGGDLLEKKHRDRIGLFTRAAAGHPNAQRSIQRVLADEFRNHGLHQQIKGGRIAEEMRDIDEEILGQHIALTGILAQDLQIAPTALEPRHRHASLDPALERALLVEREIMPGLRGQ